MAKVDTAQLLLGDIVERTVRTPDGRTENLAVVDGHLRWIETLRGPLNRG